MSSVLVVVVSSMLFTCQERSYLLLPVPPHHQSSITYLPNYLPIARVEASTNVICGHLSGHRVLHYTCHWLGKLAHPPTYLTYLRLTTASMREAAQSKQLCCRSISTLYLTSIRSQQRCVRTDCWKLRIRVFSPRRRHMSASCRQPESRN